MDKKKSSITKKVIKGAIVSVVIHVFIVLVSTFLLMSIFSGIFLTVINDEEIEAYENIDVYENENGWYQQNKQGYTAYFTKVTPNDGGTEEEFTDSQFSPLYSGEVIVTGNNASGFVVKDKNDENKVIKNTWVKYSSGNEYKYLYVDENGKVLQNTTKDGIKIDENGFATSDDAYHGSTRTVIVKNNNIWQYAYTSIAKQFVETGNYYSNTKPPKPPKEVRFEDVVFKTRRDCSGFASSCLFAYYYKKKGSGIKFEDVSFYTGSVQDRTNFLNNITTPTDFNINHIQQGDMLRMSYDSGAQHMIIIDSINYSNKTAVIYECTSKGAPSEHEYEGFTVRELGVEPANVVINTIDDGFNFIRTDSEMKNSQNAGMIKKNTVAIFRLKE